MDTLIFDKLKTKYKFYNNQKDKIVTQKREPSISVKKITFFQTDNVNKKLINNLNKNIMPNINIFKKYNRFQHLDNNNKSIVIIN